MFKGLHRVSNFIHKPFQFLIDKLTRVDSPKILLNGIIVILIDTDHRTSQDQRKKEIAELHMMVTLG